jgi:hypothetical protein
VSTVGPVHAQAVSWLLRKGSRLTGATCWRGGRLLCGAEATAARHPWSWAPVLSSGSGPDGFLFLDSGHFRFEILIDLGGTPTDPSDDEFLECLGVVKGPTGRNDTEGRDFCDDIPSSSADDAVRPGGILNGCGPLAFLEQRWMYVLSPRTPTVAGTRPTVDAHGWLDEQAAATLTGQWVDPKAGRVTFGEYARAWQAAQVHRRSTALAVDSACVCMRCRRSETGRSRASGDQKFNYASLLLRHGESVKVVQSRLGHASANETLDTYSSGRTPRT